MAQSTARVLPCMLAVAFLATLPGCQNVDQVMQSNNRLNTAYDRTLQGQHLEAIEILEELLADVEPQREQFVRQRFYAYYLLTQAHILQGLEERREAPKDRLRSYPLNPRVLSAMLYIGNSIDTIDAAEAAPRVSENGEQLVPTRLEAITPEEIRTHLQLLLVGVYGGLRFNDKMRILVDRFSDVGDLTELDTCEQLFEKTHIVEGVRPWIKVGIHRYLRRTTPKEAFRFAISALHGEPNIPDALTRAEFIAWINTGSNFKFLCNKCDEQVVPDRPKCYNCGTTYLTAYGVEKNAGASGGRTSP